MRHVKWECGCTGFILDWENSCVVVTSCDADLQDNDIFIYERKMDKPYIELAEDITVTLLMVINGLIHDGYKFRKIKGLLK